MKMFDLHCDTAGECYSKSFDLKSNNLHISLDKAQYLEKYCQLFAIWLADTFSENEAMDYFNSATDNFENEVSKNSSVLKMCTDKTMLSCKEISATLTVENGKLLANDLDNLDYIYSRGVRLMTLTWNAHNCIGNGAFSEDLSGLTGFGKAVVKKMNEIDMIVDVSHLNDNGFSDVAKIANSPFVASHSNCRSVCNHPRNLTDTQIEFICQSKGLIGLNFSKGFISENGGNYFEKLLEHIYHILDLGGEDVVCLGADFDGTDVPDNLNGIEYMPGFYDFLSRSHLGKELTDKIFFENAYNYFTKQM